MDYVDLHTHTTASDGTYSPRELVEYAAQKGLKAIAITDHDTTAGIDEAKDASLEYGVEVIAGIEIATVVDGCDVHLLGLFIDYHSEEMQKQVAKMAHIRENRNLLMIDKLQENGINISRKDLERYPDQVIARAQIAEILIERGYASDLKDALRKYLNPGSLGYVQKQTDDPQTVIDVIHKSQGICIVAHINQISPNQIEVTDQVIEKLAHYGVDGIETHYCEYDAMWQAKSIELAKRFNLLESGGSDFHGSRKKNLDLGVGYGNLAVPYDILAKQKAYIQNR